MNATKAQRAARKNGMPLGAVYRCRCTLTTVHPGRASAAGRTAEAPPRRGRSRSWKINQTAVPFARSRTMASDQDRACTHPHCRRRPAAAALPLGGPDRLRPRCRRGRGRARGAGAGKGRPLRPAAARSRHAGCRRARSASPAAPVRLPPAGAGADGGRLDLARGRGDARRRQRLPGQAGRARAAGGLDPQRAGAVGAVDRAAPHGPGRGEPAGLRRPGRRRAEDARGDRAGAAGGAVGHPRADRGRVRLGQGGLRPGDPRLVRPRRRPLRRRQLRRPAGDPGRVRSCSGTRKGPSLAQRRGGRAGSRRRMAARCSSTRSASCRPRRRSSCCAPSSRARSTRSARRSPSG